MDVNEASACSLVTWCDQCVALTDSIGHLQYPCLWCETAGKGGRCLNSGNNPCQDSDQTSIRFIGECPRVGLPIWLLALVATSGLLFVLVFHLTYCIWKFAVEFHKNKPEKENETMAPSPETEQSRSIRGIFNRKKKNEQLTNNIPMNME